MIEEVAIQINTIVKNEHPKILAQLAKEIFDSRGHSHGRNWDDNTPATAKRKGKNHRNVDTGLLQETLEQDGFLMQDNYMDDLPQSSPDRNYKYANYGNNKFDDIGRTENDKLWVKERLVTTIKEQMNNG